MSAIGRIREDSSSPTEGADFDAKVVAIDRHAGWSGFDSTTHGPSAIHGELLPISSLYPSPDVASPELSRAMELLPEAVDHLRRAISIARDQDDAIGADLEIQRIHPILFELFNCRALGDGFGTLVNATLCSLENLYGNALSADQMEAVLRVLVVLNSEPYVDFDTATDRLDILEDAGLSIMPSGYDHLADWLDGESVR
jgi:hypothetical protein